MHLAIVFGAPANVGGLGVQSANAIAAGAVAAADVSAFGPSTIRTLPSFGGHVRWDAAPSVTPEWRTLYTSLRWEHGKLQFENDVKVGKWAAERLEKIRPDLFYMFTQVGLESLKLAHKMGIPTILESPNGHIRGFRAVYDEEAFRWCGGMYRGHPTQLMVERVEEEYELADYIRVSSNWAKSSLVSYGVPIEKVHVLQQPVDLERYRLPVSGRPYEGPLRIVFVGSLDLRKGFIYLLQALKLLDQDKYRVQLVGGTGDRCCARLLTKHRRGLNLESAPGDATKAYHQNELFVLPTLEDGSPFAVAEAMASGLPVIVTDECGSAEWINDAVSGWVVPARGVERLAQVFERAWNSREHLGQMGIAGRRSTEKRAGPQATRDVADWLTRVAAA